MQLVTLFTKVDELHRQVSSVELQPSKSAFARQLEAQSEDQDTMTDPIRDRHECHKESRHTPGNWRFNRYEACAVARALRRVVRTKVQRMMSVGDRWLRMNGGCV